MAMDPWSAGLQAVGILKGGAGSPGAVSSSNGNFANQSINIGNGLPSWIPALGGSGPQQATAFADRPDSLVLGLTGLSTTGAAVPVGNGLAVSQPVAQTSSLAVLALVGAMGFGLAFLIKKKG